MGGAWTWSRRPNIQYEVLHKELMGDGSEAAAMQVLPTGSPWHLAHAWVARPA